MTITYTLSSSQNGKRIRLNTTGSADPVDVVVGDTSQTWPTGFWVEVVNNMNNDGVVFTIAAGATLNSMSGTNTLKQGEYGRLSYLGSNVWDLHIHMSTTRVAGLKLDDLYDVDVTSAAAGYVLTKSVLGTWTATPMPEATTDLTVTAPIYLLPFFTNDDQRCNIAVSNDGKDWRLLAKAVITSGIAGRTVRDPSFRYFNGQWVCAYTNIPTSGLPSEPHFNIAISSNLVDWTHVTSVNVGSTLGTIYNWAPELFIENGELYAFFCATSNSDYINGFSIYYTKADGTDLTTWDTPTTVGGTGWPSSLLDPYVVKSGSTYVLYFKNNLTKTIGYAVSSALTTGYTVAANGSSSIVGSGATIEGPSVIRLPNGHYRMYVDKYVSNGIWYSESADLLSWTPLVRCGDPAGFTAMSHGSVLVLNTVSEQSTILSALIQGLAQEVRQSLPIACSDEGTALTTGTKVTFRMPYRMKLAEVKASLSTAQSSGALLTINVTVNGTTIFSTPLTIDNAEKTSKTATTPAVLSSTILAEDAEVVISITQIGNGTAAGLKIYLNGVSYAA